ncbi:MAG: glycosyltransferase, partial [Candidatus Sumerlaeota bacterium]|nr:glycosyltransferase [Candidatus Sumerlaeota bacterium]
MPLKVFYLLADPDLSFTDSKELEGARARATVEALCREGHRVTVFCMRRGAGGDPIESRCPILKPREGRARRWVMRNFIHPGKDGQPLLRRRLGEAALEWSVFWVCLILGAALFLPAVEAWRSRQPVDLLMALFGLALIIAAHPLMRRVRKLFVIRRKRLKAEGAQEDTPETPPAPWLLGLANLLYQRDLRRAVDAEIRAHGAPDLLWARHARFAYAFHSIARKRDLPLILEIRETLLRPSDEETPQPLRRLAGRIERRNLARADLVLALSDAVAREAAKEGARPEAVTVSPDAVDFDAFRWARLNPRRLAPGQGRFVVGLACGFEWRHGMDLLIEAATLLRPRIPNLLVWLVGAGPESAAISNLVAAKGLQDLVRLEGRADTDHKALLLGQFDVAAAPFSGVLAGCAPPSVVWEYMAAQRPIVCADT